VSAQNLTFFPFAKYIDDTIEEQNRLLQKISLTGKINAFGPSENLFETMNSALAKFISIKDELIDALVLEQKNKILGELGLRSQLAIDVLKRNLFERTADVGFLATDGEIIKFLKGQHQVEYIKDRLEAYVKKYSVYDDVILLDTNGYVKANINPKNRIKKSTDKIIEQAKKSDEFVEIYRKSDLILHKQKGLLYAHKIVDNENIIGILVLSFKFQDELDTIFKRVADNNIILYLSDKSGVIASSNRLLVPLDHSVRLYKSNDLTLFQNRKIAVSSNSKGYQGYMGLEWQSTAISLSDDNHEDSDINDAKIPPKLNKIINNAKELVEDLGDVIINGELIASKHRQYYLSPILDTLRQISTTMLQKINESATKLAAVNTQALTKNAQIATSFSIDLMDRNLYERANDCRWWALTPRFIEELSKSEPDSEAMNLILKNINDLYTVYTNLFIFDRDGKIVSASNDRTIIGEHINISAVKQTLQNSNPQNYFVSNFEKSPFYDNRATYIYFASIVNKNTTLGGVGIVFDAEVEFKAILEDSMLQNVIGFSIFCDINGKIISSTNPKLKPLDSIDFSRWKIHLEAKEAIQKVVEFQDRRYLLTIEPSYGYREYKISDNYKNDIFACSFLELNF